MSYLVLARKWRPQSFRDVVSQAHVVQALQNAIRLERLPHALLLTGSRGIGKTTIARLVAKTVNCQKNDGSETIEPCNECEMCQEITSGRSVDVIEIDGASNRSIDDVREIRDNVQYLPSKGRRKVYIIDEVHMLTREAFNALLKTLEEPPRHVLFLFATTEPHKIPITILSRCQRFDFKRIGLPLLRGHLQRVAEAEGLQISDVALTMVARSAAGGMRDGLSLLDQVIAFGGTQPSDEEVAQAIGAVNRTLLYRLGASLLRHDPTTCLQCVDELFSFAYDMRQLTQELATFLRDLLVIRICEDPSEVTDLAADEIQEMRQLAGETSPELLQQMFRLLTQEAEAIAQTSNPRLLLEMTLIRMARLQPLRPFDSLLKQLGALETRLLEGGGKASGGGAQGGGAQMSPTPNHPPGMGGMHTSPRKANPMNSGPMPGPNPVDPPPRAASQASPDQHHQSTAPRPSVSHQAASLAPRGANAVPQQSRGFDSQNDRGTGALKERKAPQMPSSHRSESAPHHKNEEPPLQTSPASPAPAPSTPRAGRELVADAAGPSSSPNPSLSNAPANGVGVKKTTPAPAPKSSVAPSPSSGTGEVQMNPEQWEEVIQKFRERKPFLAPILEAARFHIVPPKVLMLCFPPNHFIQHDIAKDPRKQSAIESFLAEQGFPFRVKVEQLKQKDMEQGGGAKGSQSIQETKRLREQKVQEAMREEVRTHPMIRHLLDVIPDIEIVKIEPIQNEAVSEEEIS